MEFKRERYLDELKEMRHTRFVKVITGMRRCGKTYLLFNLYKSYLLSDGVPADHIFEMAFDDPDNAEFLDCRVFYEHVKEFMEKDTGEYYVLLDEVQLMDGFEGVLNGLLRRPDVDIYVTGSNSRFLSKDVITEFRGRGWEIRMRPLSFSEFMECYDGDRYEGLTEYMRFGGMPEAVLARGDERKTEYLDKLFSTVYLRDIADRHRLRDGSATEGVLDLLASSVGSLINPDRLVNMFGSVRHVKISPNTVREYVEWLCDAFIVEKSMRYDVKGGGYIGTPYKYYFTDTGLRNSRVGFRQLEETHIMENVIYNELVSRGYKVDVGDVIVNEIRGGKNVRTRLETDFVCNLGPDRVYVQSALSMPDRESEERESRPLLSINDGFKKVIVTGGVCKPWYTERGIYVMSVYDFLLDSESLRF